VEKHTISALIVAGATVIGAVVQVLVVRVSKRKRAAGRTEPGEPRGETDGVTGSDPHDPVD
jgi:hypothetical protein